MIEELLALSRSVSRNAQTKSPTKVNGQSKVKTSFVPSRRWMETRTDGPFLVSNS